MKKELEAESLTEQKHENLRQRHAESSLGQLPGFEPVETEPSRVVLRLLKPMSGQPVIAWLQRHWRPSWR